MSLILYAIRHQSSDVQQYTRKKQQQLLWFEWHSRQLVDQTAWQLGGCRLIYCL